MPKTAQKKSSSGRTSRTEGGAQKRSSDARKPQTTIEKYGVCAGIMIFVAIMLFIAMSGVSALFVNWAATVAGALTGAGYYVTAFALIAAAIRLLVPKRNPPPSMLLQLICILCIPVFIGMLFHVFGAKAGSYGFSGLGDLAVSGAEDKAGGLVAGGLCELFVFLFSKIGAQIFIVILSGLCILYAAGQTVGHFIGYIIRFFRYITDKLQAGPGAENDGEEEGQEEKAEPPWQNTQDTPAVAPGSKQRIDIPLDNRTMVKPKGLFGVEKKEEARPAPIQDGTQTAVADPDTTREIAEEAQNIEKIIGGSTVTQKELYTYPPISLLREDKHPPKANPDLETRANAQKLLETLSSFGVDAKIVNITRGPTITRYEVQLNPGTKIAKLTALSDDIAISMSAQSIRIMPIADKSAIGIEVPNRDVALVCIRDVINTREFTESPSKLTVALGKEITGKPVVWDIARLPHLLIAGTTGSGKSVCINSLLVSLLYKSSPEEVKLIMIDPKMIELGVYNGIPHLLIPVVTDPKKAAGALQWAVLEMMSRYKRFAELGVRSLTEYNDEVRRKDLGEAMPQIVIVIDELADLMLVARTEVEEAICRIAQMARAAGMHLIIATQRPSADIITGIMKANIPSRIAFSVASQIESRIILDKPGAERLIGRGDMFFSPIGSNKFIRIQGCFISSEEVEAVIAYVKKTMSEENTYDDSILEQIEKTVEESGKTGKNGHMGEEGLEEDDLLDQAIELIVASGIASTSMLQRRLGVGHARAGRMIDQMEDRGIVGPFEGSKARKVLLSRQEWQEMQMRADE